jgi:hypothetical protein
VSFVGGGLLGVVRNELFDGGLHELDLGQDLVGGGGPRDGRASVFQWSM